MFRIIIAIIIIIVRYRWKHYYYTICLPLRQTFPWRGLSQSCTRRTKAAGRIWVIFGRGTCVVSYSL